MDDLEDIRRRASVGDIRNHPMDHFAAETGPRICGFGSEDENEAALASMEWTGWFPKGDV